MDCSTFPAVAGSRTQRKLKRDCPTANGRRLLTTGPCGYNPTHDPELVEGSVPAICLDFASAAAQFVAADGGNVAGYPHGGGAAERHGPVFAASSPRPASRFALFSGPAPSHHIQILSENRPLGPEDYARLRQLAESVIRQRLGSLAVDLHHYGRAQAGMQLTANPARKPPPIGSPSGRPLFMTGFEEHSRIIDGRWPNSPRHAQPRRRGAGSRHRAGGRQRHGLRRGQPGVHHALSLQNPRSE